MDLSRITSLSKRLLSEKDGKEPKLPGISVLYRDSVSEIESVVYEPVLCLILQGEKFTAIGDQHVSLRPGDALLVSHDLPVISRITTASRSEPYLALIVTLDLSIIRSLYQLVADTWSPAASVRSLSAGEADDAWLAPLVRYLELMEHPLDAKVLGPSILRELHYRLMLSPIGGMLRDLLRADSHASRIAKVIEQIRSDYRSTLLVPDLARFAGMSESAFHQNFKAVTGTTPLQYLKDLRLIEARSLLADHQCSVSETAYAVGYESPTHFSRDYSRKFGAPPSKTLLAS